MKPPRLAIAAAVLAVLALVATAWQLAQRRAAPAPPPLTADEIAARIADHHRDADHLLARARLEVRNHELQRTARQDGLLTLQRPGQLRWDVFPAAPDAGPAPLARSFICDGVELHSIDFVGSEIMRLRRDGHPLVLTTALFTAAAWPTAYTAALAPPPDAAPHLDGEPTAATYTISLTPHGGGPRLVVTADAADFHIRQIVVDDGYNLSRLTLGAVDLTTAPDPRRFALDRSRPPLVAFRFVDASL